MMYPWEKTLYHAMAEGKTVGEACAEYDGMPETAEVFKTLKEDPAFKARYEEALEMWAYASMDKLLTVADDSSKDYIVRGGVRIENKEAIQRSKLRVQTRERMIEWANPKRFKDKEPITNTLVLAGMDENQVTDKLREILANVAKRIQDQKQQQEMVDVSPMVVETTAEHPSSPSDIPVLQDGVLPKKIAQAEGPKPVANINGTRRGSSLVFEMDPHDHPALA